MPVQTSSIVSLTLSKLSHYEFSQLVQEYLQTSAEKGLDFGDDPVPEGLIGQLQKVQDVYVKALHQPKVVLPTLSLKEADKRRDSAWLYIKQLILARKYSESKQEQVAFEQLYPLIKDHKTLTKSNAETKTAMIKQFIEYTKTSPYAMHCSTLLLVVPLASLQDAQDAYDKIYQSRTENQLAATPSQLTERRKEVQQAYRKLVSYAELMCQIKTDQVYKDWLAIINNGRQHFLDNVRRKNTSKAKTTVTVPVSSVDTNSIPQTLT